MSGEKSRITGWLRTPAPGWLRTPAPGWLYAPGPPTTLQLGVGGVVRAWLILLCACVFLAAFSAVVQWKSFLLCLVYALAIVNLGFWIIWGLHRAQNLRRICWKRTSVGAALGISLGFGAVRAWEVRGLGRPFFEWSAVVPLLAGLLLFFGVMLYYFQARAQVAEGRVRLREETAQRLEQQQRLTQAELKLLQAQIEPHFLFNTLSNVLQLVDEKPDGAKRMLVNLTRYLRASLQRTRTGATTLDEELDLVRAYLGIQAERMGARLAYRIECPAELGALPLPPLLLQPLVENAVRHGIEANPLGGEVQVRGAREEDALVLEVLDTGPGIGAESRAGVGLVNVRARVRAVSQGRGSVVIHPNVPHGLCVRLSLPLPRHAEIGAGLAAGGRPS